MKTIKWAIIIGILTISAALYIKPAQAFSIDFNIDGIHIGFNDWYSAHNYWNQQCYGQPQRGHWGRNPRYDSWCQDNQRFRDNQPDRQWQNGHPRDHGRRGGH